jgi:hypothetical protein
MAEIPVREWLTASDLVFWQWNNCGWSSDVGSLAVPDGTRLALVSATIDSDGEQRLLQQSACAAAVGGG